jgi:hypothetical protein
MKIERDQDEQKNKNTKKPERLVAFLQQREL